MLGTAIRDGEWVQVDPKHKTGKPDSEGGLGFVKFRFPTPTKTKVVYDVSYSVTKWLSPDISPRRLNPALMETTARKRDGDTALAPSLLSCSRQQIRRRLNFPRPTTQVAQKRTTKSGPKDTNELLILAKSFDAQGSTVNKAQAYVMKMRKDGCKGWLRKVHRETSKVTTAQLNSEERHLAFDLCLVLDLNQDGVYPAIAHAWGLETRTLKLIFEKAVSVDRKYAFERKKRIDAGMTVFNSTTKQSQVYTAEYVYKKEMRAKNLEAPPNNNQLRLQWQTLTSDDAFEFEFKVWCWLNRGQGRWARSKFFLHTRSRSAADSWRFGVTQEQDHRISWTWSLPLFRNQEAA
jgi:hypothetical protein